MLCTLSPICPRANVCLTTRLHHNCTRWTCSCCCRYCLPSTHRAFKIQISSGDPQSFADPKKPEGQALFYVKRDFDCCSPAPPPLCCLNRPKMQIHAGAIPAKPEGQSELPPHGELLGQIRDPCSLCNSTVDAYQPAEDQEINGSALGEHRFRFSAFFCQPGLLCSVRFCCTCTLVLHWCCIYTLYPFLLCLLQLHVGPFQHLFLHWTSSCGLCGFTSSLIWHSPPLRNALAARAKRPCLTSKTSKVKRLVRCTR
jgi:hypothetical protein